MAGVMESRGKFPLIDADPHASRVIRYMRTSDYLWWGGATAAMPAAVYLWHLSRLPEMAELETEAAEELAALTKARQAGRPVPPNSSVLSAAARMVKARATPVPAMIGCGLVGFIGGFMIAYQNSSFRFWGWKENKREEEKDLKELSERAAKGLALYGTSEQPEWIKTEAARQSMYSQLFLHVLPMFNLVNHKYHGTDPAKYGVQPKESDA